MAWKFGQCRTVKSACHAARTSWSNSFVIVALSSLSTMTAVSASVEVKSVEKKGDTYEFEKKVGDSEKISGGAEVGVGVVSGGMGMSHKTKSSRGYKFSIDPKDEHYDAGSDKFVVGFAAIAAELGAANTQEALDAFAAKYPWTVTEKVTTKGTEDGTTGSIGS